MATGDVWKVIMHFTWGTVECRSGFHLIEGSGGGGADPSFDVFDNVAIALGADPLTGFSDQLTWRGCTIVDAQPGVLPTRSFLNLAIAGDVVDANPLPPQSAAVIKWQTGVKGVVGVYATQGRMYMPGIPQDGQISGFLQVPFQGALSAFGSRIFNAYVADGTQYQLNVISYTPNSSPQTVRAFNPVTGFDINNVVRSQRRREFGVGI
jgi:hypothetical protein